MADKPRIPSLIGENALDMGAEAPASKQVDIDPTRVEMFFGVLKLIGQPARIVSHGQILPLLAKLSDESGEIVLPQGFDDSDPASLEFARMCLLSLAKQMELVDIFAVFGELEQEVAGLKEEMAGLRGVMESSLTQLLEGLQDKIAQHVAALNSALGQKEEASSDEPKDDGGIEGTG